MKTRKYLIILIIGIILLVFQAIGILGSILGSGLANPESGAYEIGYLVGYFSPGIIGVVLLVVFFIKNHGAK